jgi:hypothetical protein
MTRVDHAADSAYSPEQYAASYPEGIERHWWTAARTRIVAAFVARCARPDATLLEVGCGMGVSVRGLRRLGVRCSGVEVADVVPLPEVADCVTTGTNALDLPEAVRRRYDTVLLLDVIEHLSDPDGFLRDLAAGFPSLETVVVTVPARGEIWSNYDAFFGHFRRYDLRGLRELAARLGWQTRLSRYFFHLLYPPAWLMKQLGIPRAVKIAAPRGWRCRIHALVANAMVLESRWLPGSWPGSSAIACFDLRPRAPAPHGAPV